MAIIRLSFWVYCLFLCFWGYIDASIAQIQSIKDIDQHIQNHHQVLVVFDIDDTLTILSEPAFQRPNFKVHHADTFNKIMSPLNEKEKLMAFTLPLLTTPSDLIEKDTPIFIKTLQKNGIKTIALTAATGGRLAGVAIEDHRIEELKRVGIDFSKSFTEMSETAFAGFPIAQIGKSPFYKNGVILANEQDKGLVLVEFLKTIPWKPDLIIFVDDRIEHVQAVQKGLAIFDPHIHFKGFHYQNPTANYRMVEAELFNNKWIDVVEQTKQSLLHLY